MEAVKIIASAVISIAAALGFIAIGMRIANENNKKVWEKYYEGQRTKGQYMDTQYTQKVVSLTGNQRKAK